MAAHETILIFDSGLGGLTVYREVAAARPHADFVYVADDAAFPYGALKEPALVARVVALMGDLIAKHRPDLIVIACNTASTIVLPDLRKKFSLPFVGTVPAIKPACAARSRAASPCSAPRRRWRANIPARSFATTRRVARSRWSDRRSSQPMPRPTLPAHRSAMPRSRRNRPVLCRRRRAHRYGRARLHALSAAARPLTAGSRPGR